MILFELIQGYVFCGQHLLGPLLFPIILNDETTYAPRKIISKSYSVLSLFNRQRTRSYVRMTKISKGRIRIPWRLVTVPDILMRSFNKFARCNTISYYTDGLVDILVVALGSKHEDRN